MHTVTRWSATLGGSVAAAVLVGAVAARVNPDDDRLETIVFALMTWPALLGLLYVALFPKDELPTRPEDSIESAWITQATSGAFLDLVLVLGLATTAQAVLDVTALPMVLILVLAMTDAAVRFLILRRREA